METDHAILADRAALAETIAPVTGPAADMAKRAMSRVAARIEAGADVRQVSLVKVQEAIRRYRAGDAVSPLTAAWVLAGLRILRVRDDAWSRLDPAYASAHLRLLTDLTRLARSGYVAAPASLLAFTAWQCGNSALANVALDRALAGDPQYSMALLLRQVLASGAPPSMARLPITPEEVAVSYAEMDDEAAEPVTAVVFRKERDGGEVIAVFPYEPGTNDPATCAMYAHNGQHGCASQEYVIRETRPASPEEYASLKRELERPGPGQYRLDVLPRMPRDAYKVRAAKV